MRGADNSQSRPTWSTVKKQLAGFDRAALLSLVSDLYALSKDNQSFLHVRLALGNDPLKPYKDKIERWLFPDLLRNQDISVAKAKRAISDYRKAARDTAGQLELMTFFCEQAAAFATDIALDDEGYYDALVRMFEAALKLTKVVPAAQRVRFLLRLQRVAKKCQPIGYSVGDDMAQLLSLYAPRAESEPSSDIQ